jgi:hypothetical protein
MPNEEGKRVPIARRAGDLPDPPIDKETTVRRLTDRRSLTAALVAGMLVLALAAPALAGTYLQGNKYCSTGYEVHTKGRTTYSATHYHEGDKTFSQAWMDYGEWRTTYGDSNHQQSVPWKVATTGYMNTPNTYAFCANYS